MSAEFFDLETVRRRRVEKDEVKRLQQLIDAEQKPNQFARIAQALWEEKKQLAPLASSSPSTAEQSKKRKKREQYDEKEQNEIHSSSSSTLSSASSSPSSLESARQIARECRLVCDRENIRYKECQHRCRLAELEHSRFTQFQNELLIPLNLRARIEHGLPRSEYQSRLSIEADQAFDFFLLKTDSSQITSAYFSQQRQRRHLEKQAESFSKRYTSAQRDLQTMFEIDDFPYYESHERKCEQTLNMMRLRSIKTKSDFFVEFSSRFPSMVSALQLSETALRLRIDSDRENFLLLVEAFRSDYVAQDVLVGSFGREANRRKTLLLEQEESFSKLLEFEEYHKEARCEKLCLHKNQYAAGRAESLSETKFEVEVSLLKLHLSAMKEGVAASSWSPSSFSPTAAGKKVQQEEERAGELEETQEEKRRREIKLDQDLKEIEEL